MILAVENKITKLEMYEQMKESPVCPLTDQKSYGKDGNTNAAGAFGYKIFATDVYPEYEKARSVHKALSEMERRLAEDKQNESEIVCNCTAAPVTETKIGYMPIETDLSIARYR
ncbi:hypothetical protein ALC56_10023 [Trachymyrmex septentrionalis]|uniref:Uncharacterized protein n=1 Tax=Trachymyrmex septentrionalis TaxID=34720 RepID=A0A195F4Z6_9HYME|nr:hypothetical protein ALC56_10023 [Trachymyrmex septentrionalis]